jgi:hypothetical protein
MVEDTAVAASSRSLGDCLSVSDILQVVGYDAIESALLGSDRSKHRLRDFPDHLVMMYCVCMSLYMGDSYSHAFGRLRDALIWLSGSNFDVKEISDSAIVQGRDRVGNMPFERLLRAVAQPLALKDAALCYRSMPLFAIDGAVFDVADTKANEVIFGRPNSKAGTGAYPQVRCVALMQLRTRVCTDVEFGPVCTSNEIDLAKLIFPRLVSGSLVLLDRLYPGFDNCSKIISSGAHFLMRVKTGIKLEPTNRLADGSYLATMYEYNEKTKRTGATLTVRVIQYRVGDGSEVYRLITDILDADLAPATELAALYPSRWDEETFYGELKTVLRQPRIVLRSKSPRLVLQELYGLFTAHYALRKLMFYAAQRLNVSPTSLSFKHTIYVIQTIRKDDFSP